MCGWGMEAVKHILWLLSVAIFCQVVEDSVHSKKMKFIHRKKQLILMSIEKQRWQITFTQTHTYTLKESVYEREGGAGDLEQS